MDPAPVPAHRPDHQRVSAYDQKMEPPAQALGRRVPEFLVRRARNIHTPAYLAPHP
jgi:hypothetical protein